LNIAAIWKRNDTVDFLLTRMSRINKANQELPSVHAMFHDAICEVSRAGNDEMVIRLMTWFTKLRIPAPIKDVYNIWIADAIESKNVRYVKAALRLPYSKRSQLLTWTNFHHAIQYGNAPIIKVLISDGKFDIHRYFWYTMRSPKTNECLLTGITY
jgi:hypothetical protein